MSSMRALAIAEAQRAGIPEELFLRLIKQESNWNPTAKSGAGAYGLTQAMPATWKQPGYGVAPGGDINDPNEQLRFGADYMAAMLKQYGGDPVKASAAYNWGGGNVDKWQKGQATPPKETLDYMNIVGRGQGPTTGGDDIMTMSTRSAPEDDPNYTSIMDPNATDDSKVTFHPGMGLQSIGAAIAAGAQGKSAARELSEIRNNYFSQREAQLERGREEHQRKALRAMFEAKGYTDLVEALDQGAGMEALMPAFTQRSTFEHQRGMQDDQQAFTLTRDETLNGFATEAAQEAFGNDVKLSELSHEQRLEIFDKTVRKDTAAAVQAQTYDVQKLELGFEHDTKITELAASLGLSKQEAQNVWQAAQNDAKRQHQSALQVDSQLFTQNRDTRLHDYAKEMAQVDFGNDVKLSDLSHTQKLDIFAKTVEKDIAAASQGQAYDVDKLRMGFDHDKVITKLAADLGLEKQEAQQVWQSAHSEAQDARNKELQLEVTDRRAGHASDLSAQGAGQAEAAAVAERLWRSGLPQDKPTAIEVFEYRQKLEQNGASPAVLEAFDRVSARGGVTVNTTEKAEVAGIKSDIAQLATISEQSLIDRDALNSLNNMQRILAEKPDLQTGQIYQELHRPLSILSSLGLLPEGIKSDQDLRQFLDQDNTKLAIASRTPGQVSNYEQESWKAMNPGVGTPNGQLRVALARKVHMLERNQAYAEFVRSASDAQNPNRVPLVRADEQWRQMMLEGDPRTKPIVLDVENFTNNNRAAMIQKFKENPGTGFVKYKGKVMTFRDYLKSLEGAIQ